MEKPWLLIDVDGVLNPEPLIRRSVKEVPPEFAERGFELHKIKPKGFTRFFQVGLSPEHGRMLLAMQDVFQLGWATTWEDEANTKIGPKIGLPKLPYAKVSERGDKAQGVRELVGNTPFAWLDDLHYWHGGSEFTDDPNVLLVAVNPEVGLTAENLTEAREWARNTVGRTSFICPECGYYRDTPNHELGCNG